MTALEETEPLLHRYERVLRRASRSLSDFLDRDEEARAILSTGLLLDRDDCLTRCRHAASQGMGQLRLTKRRLLLLIAALDLAGEAPLEDVGRSLSDLADACLQAALEHVGAPESLAVIAMGKLGGRELNYVSDIDVMFVFEGGDLEAAIKAAGSLLATLGEVGPEGRAFAIDANLRPEGRSGVLVRSLDGYLEHYRRWAQPWEHQALIKARVAAGDRSVGTTLVDETRAYVFPEEVTAERVASIRKMKARVEEHAARPTRRSRREGEDVKLGPGGIRDIEFSVQLLQLVHGGSDRSVRSPTTLIALRELADGGYIAEDDAAGLSVAYRWLRNVEHRLQLWQERRVRRLPVEPDRLARLARSMGFRDEAMRNAAERFETAHNGVLADVRGRFEKVFYRPMVESLADASTSRLSGDALKERLRILGFRDVDRAERTLTGIVLGTSRRTKLLRVLTPAVLRWLASSPLPDEGLFAFLRLGESLGDRLDVLGSLRDNPAGLATLARVLGSGRVLGELLEHVPEEVQTIADPRGLAPLKDREQLIREAIASLSWREPARRLDGLRRFKRRELLRVALSDLGGAADVEAVGWTLADIADSCLEAALGEDRPHFAVIGMGKLGGRELGYSSDIDVLFVHRGDPQGAEAVAEDLVKAIGEVTPEGQAWRIDAGLRPEGRAGPLARSFAAFMDYYERWAKPWEFQALLKARFAAGDAELGAEFIDAARRFVYRGGLVGESLAEIRHLKARMERERIPRATEPRRHLKMGPGGTSDVEFAVQIMQLRHAHEVEELRTPNTMEALRAVRRAELLDDRDVTWLENAYSFLSSMRNRLFFLVGRATDVLPARPEDLEALGIAMGYRDQPRQELEEDYRRITRRARRVAEPLIYGS